MFRSITFIFWMRTAQNCSFEMIKISQWSNGFWERKAIKFIKLKSVVDFDVQIIIGIVPFYSPWKVVKKYSTCIFNLKMPSSFEQYSGGGIQFQYINAIFRVVPLHSVKKCALALASEFGSFSSITSVVAKKTWSHEGSVKTLKAKAGCFAASVRCYR